MTLNEWEQRLRSNQCKIMQIAKNYGIAPQLRMLAEECSELAKEALKAIRSKGANKEALIEEIADVEIMIEQIRLLMGIRYEDIFTTKERKLERQMQRIGEGR